MVSINSKYGLFKDPLYQNFSWTGIVSCTPDENLYDTQRKVHKLRYTTNLFAPFKAHCKQISRHFYASATKSLVDSFSNWVYYNYRQILNGCKDSNQ